MSMHQAKHVQGSPSPGQFGTDVEPLTAVLDIHPVPTSHVRKVSGLRLVTRENPCVPVTLCNLRRACLGFMIRCET
jgi:hypothetical protein